MADTSGHFSVPVTLDRVFTPFNAGHPVDCAGPAEQCVIGAAHLDLSGLSIANLDFTPQPPVITLGNASVPEGNSGTKNLVLPVTLSRAASGTVTVNWTTPSAPGAPVGQADPATDFTAASGTVTFAPGDTAESVTISVNGDTLVEPDEAIPVTFSNATNATIGGTGVATGTITNDDHATVVPGGAAVPEGNSGTVALNVPLTLSNPSTQTITVQWFTGPAGPAPRADPATDFVAASGTVTFDPGQTAKTVTITVRGDTLVEPDEWITISFNHPTNAHMGGFWRLGFGVIQNDD
jgi:chitinase